jgi:hypothetical protein
LTVIAYDGKYVAADTLITGDSGMWHRTRKLDIHGTQVLATVGAADHGEALMIWFKDGCNPAAFPHSTQQKDAYLYVFEWSKPVICFQTWPAPIVFPVTCFTAGTGGEIARAAMWLDRDARQACDVAIELNIYCGGDIEYVDLEKLANGTGVGIVTYDE